MIFNTKNQVRTIVRLYFIASNTQLIEEMIRFITYKSLRCAYCPSKFKYITYISCNNVTSILNNNIQIFIKSIDN